MIRTLPSIALVVALAGLAPQAGFAQTQTRSPDRPNIVLMFPDNLGWGEVGAYGGNRGVPTPHIDRIAEMGIRLTNFNVENSCTVIPVACVPPG